MRKILLLTLCAFLSQLSVAQRQTRAQYIDKYNKIAVREMQRVGIPASITLAQGILESGDGNSTLARKANNHFGIKCHKDWKGESMYRDDDRPNECFRSYKDANQSFVDHSEFLCTHQRYAFLFKYGTTDYKSWAKGLKQAGYATSPTYADRLIQIIEQNNLQRFDKAVQPSTTPEKQTEIAEQTNNFVEVDVNDMEVSPFGNIKTNNGVDYVEVLPGDNLESVAARYEMEPWQLRMFNDIDSKSVKLKTGQRLYISRKQSKAEKQYKTHTVKKGETMHDISQQYAIRLKALYKLNLMDEGTQPNEGDIIQLRKKAKKK
ncbi:MAG: glucosaminidase domain-containing protein [Salinivirgaceae bacterium]|nr:glucosaminidase domain-containing protein [Salinivirgaceae bacterium]